MNEIIRAGDAKRASGLRDRVLRRDRMIVKNPQRSARDAEVW